MDTIIFLFFVVGLIYLGLLFLHPKLSFYLLIFLCLIQFDWFIRYAHVPAILGRLTYFAAMISGLIIAVDLLMRRIQIQKQDQMIKIVYTFIVLIIFVILISNSYNEESLIIGFYEIRYYLIMGILCTGFYYYNLLDLSKDRLFKILTFIALLQIPFSIVQFIAAGMGSVRTLDSVTGTFSEYGSLVCHQMLSIGLLLTYRLQTKKDLFKLNSVILIVLLLIPVILSKSRSATGFAVLVLLFVYLKDAMSKQKFSVLIRNIIIASMMICFFSVIFYYFFWAKSYKIRQELNIDYVVAYFTRAPLMRSQGADPRMGRVRAVIEAARLTSQNPVTLAFGCGSGSVSEASFLNKNGRFYQVYGPLAGIWRTQYSKILSEIGIIGFCLFIYLFYYVYRLIKFKKLIDPIIKDGYQYLIFIIIIFSIYFRVLDSFYFSLIFALFIGSFKSNLFECDKTSSSSINPTAF